MANQQRFYLKRRKGTNASKIKALNYWQAPIFFLNLQCDFLRKKERTGKRKQALGKRRVAQSKRRKYHTRRGHTSS
ncbi:hypothetical protein [Hallella sp.]|uniref:hypothetical protein n=1 Tax=Hallella sp. TaxID=2980186 RepID=UPI003078F43B